MVWRSDPRSSSPDDYLSERDLQAFDVAERSVLQPSQGYHEQLRWKSLHIFEGNNRWILMIAGGISARGLQRQARATPGINHGEAPVHTQRRGERMRRCVQQLMQHQRWLAH